MSAVPVPKRGESNPRIQPDMANMPVDNRRANTKPSDLTKYTDVRRTSSASFKPPMTKESLKPQVQPQPKDSSWFAPFSYIKTMFGTKPANAPANATNVEKNNKNINKINNKTSSPQPKKTTVKNTSHKPESKYSRYTSDLDDGKPLEGNMQSALLVSADETRPISISPSFSVSPNNAITKRDQPVNTSSVFEMEDDNDPSGGKYKSINGDKASTYLHTPDKKGTTSFRITTQPKLGPKQTPTILSPSFSSHQQKKTTKPINRKGSTSPKKTRADSGSSRLRSKSTPDSSSMKPRPTFNFSNMIWTDGSTEPPRPRPSPKASADPKHVSSWHSQQDYKQRRAASLREAREAQKNGPSKYNGREHKEENRHDNSPLTSLFSFLSPEEKEERIIDNRNKKKSADQKLNEYVKSKNGMKDNQNQKEVKREVKREDNRRHDSPTRLALESAYEAISSTFSEITGKQENRQFHDEKSTTGRSANSPVRGRQSRAHEKNTVNKAEEERNGSPLQSTLNMIQSFVQDTLTPKQEEEMRRPDPVQDKIQRRGASYKPERTKPPPSNNNLKISSSHTRTNPIKREESPVRELSNDRHKLHEGLGHRRPGDPSDYNITPHYNIPKSRRRPPTQHQNDVAKGKQDEDRENNEGDGEEMTLSSAFQKFSNLFQSKLSPMLDDTKQKSTEPPQDTTTIAPEGSNKKPENNHYHYLKKSGKNAVSSSPSVSAYMGGGGVKSSGRDSSVESKKGNKVQSSFLKSHRSDRSTSRSPPPPAHVNSTHHQLSPKIKLLNAKDKKDKKASSPSLQKKLKLMHSNAFTKTSSPKLDSPHAAYKSYQGSSAALSAYRGGSPTQY